jgi:four helix bundle protein
VVIGQWSVGEKSVAVRHYIDLIAWQKAIDLVMRVYEATNGFPPSERFGLTNQLRRAAVSVPSNIAEGQGRHTTRDFLRCLSIASGSLQELETQLIIAHRLNYLEQRSQTGLFSLTSEVARLINGLANSLARKNPPSDPLTPDH